MTNKSYLELLDWAETLLCQPSIPQDAVKKWRDEKNGVTEHLRKLEYLYTQTEKLFGARSEVEKILGELGAFYDSIQLQHKKICERHDVVWDEYNEVQQALFGPTKPPVPPSESESETDTDYLIPYATEILAAVGVDARDDTELKTMLNNVVYYMAKAYNENH